MFRICSVLIAFLLAAPLWALQPEITGRPRVIDADTIEVAGQRIRLGGIDAPEMAETCRAPDGRSWRCGRWATQEAERLLNGQTLRCQDLGERTHNRIVGRCYLGEKDIAVLLIEAGAARTCLRFAREQGQDAIYLAAEVRAQRARVGIFSGALNPPAGFCNLADTRAESGTCAIKGNVSQNGQIYHLPGQRDYNRVNMNKPGVRWFCSEAEARAAGWRPAQR